MKTTTKFLKLTKVFLAATAISAAIDPGASAASMVWQSPRAITGTAADVITSGTLVGAYSLVQTGYNVTAAPIPATVNGVGFYAVLPNSTLANLTTAGFSGGADLFGSTSGAFAALTDVDYQRLLRRGNYTNNASTSAPLQITLNNLTPNTTYMVQIWANDSRGGTVPRGEVFKSLAGNPSATLTYRPPAVGGLGQYIVGTFTTGASETTQNIISTTTLGQVNALQIRTASGPTAWLQDEKYGIFVHWLPGMSDIPPPATAAIKPVGQQGGAWNFAVNNFNVNSFADQVAQTGAGYVIFTNGQTSGFYCAPNSTFEGYGGVVRGEFTPHRDLISDLADALNSRGIKLMIYMAGEGPVSAPILNRPNGSTANVKAGLDAGTGGQAYSNTFRSRYNAMIQEWSLAWGSKVSGWWLDCCWKNSGYGDNAISENNDGPGNLSAFIAATKSGNPSAIVACNPGADNYSARSANQDYIAGEAGQYTTPYAKFNIYPSSPFVLHGGKNMLWHTLSYLGYWWGEPSLKYVDEELISYISSVNRLGGVVTMDVSVNAAGQIADLQFEQLKRIKSALRPTISPAVPSEPNATFVNLALYKPAYLVRNTNGAPLEASVGLKLQAHAGVDGDISTHARAAYDWAYSYLVDLESLQNINRIAVTFDADCFATAYEIAYSSDRTGPWHPINSTQTSYTSTSGGLKVHDTDTTKSARWLRIKAIEPDSTGDFGYQMGIAEFEVYNANGPAQTSKDTVWIDESTPTGATLQVGGSGVWKWTSTQDGDWSTLNLPYPLSGLSFHWSPSATGWNERSFESTIAPLSVGIGDSLYCYIWIDPADIPSEIMLSWKDSSGWEHRAFWGSNLISSGATLGTNALRNMGSLPGSGAWVLIVPASQVGLEGSVVTGMRFSTYGGRVIFDRAGKTKP